MQEIVKRDPKIKTHFEKAGGSLPDGIDALNRWMATNPEAYEPIEAAMEELCIA